METASIDRERVERLASSLKLDAGDAVVLRAANCAQADQLGSLCPELRANLAAAGREPSVIIVLEPGMSMQRLDERAMASHGWVRAPAAGG